MGKKSLNNEEKMLDLLEKNLIIQLYVNGATRDQITEILKVGSVKVSKIIKYLKKKEV